jgi:hypothetical protein
MKLYIISGAIGAACFIFGYWGKFSAAGRQKYDEMAGIIPEVSYYLGIVLLIIAACICAFGLIKK